MVLLRLAAVQLLVNRPPMLQHQLPQVMTSIPSPICTAKHPDFGSYMPSASSTTTPAILAANHDFGGTPTNFSMALQDLLPWVASPIRVAIIKSRRAKLLLTSSRPSTPFRILAEVQTPGRGKPRKSLRHGSGLWLWTCSVCRGLKPTTACDAHITLPETIFQCTVHQRNVLRSSRAVFLSPGSTVCRA